MPAPSLFKVNDQEKQYLKSCIEKEYNIKIESAPSCKLLSELIFKRKKITISYSTIRRLFNLIPKNVGSPSMYTLDSIVKSIGFADWKEFKNYQEKYNVNSINQNIQLYFNQIDDSNNLIFETVKNISLIDYFNYIRTCEFVTTNSLLAKTSFENFGKNIVEDELEIAKKELISFELVKSVMKRENLNENDLQYLSPQLGRSFISISILKDIGVSTYYLKQIIKECLQFNNWNLEIEDILTRFLPLFIDEGNIKDKVKSYINDIQPMINDKTINFHIGKIKKQFEFDIDPGLIKSYLSHA